MCLFYHYPDDVWVFFNWLADMEGSLSVYVYAEPVSSPNPIGNNKVLRTLRNQFFNLGIQRKLNALKEVKFKKTCIT